MTIPPVAIGIDVSKHHLDLYDPQHGPGRLPNTPAAIQAWADSLPGRCALVVFEATGPYDTALRRALAGAGVAQARINPEQARAFARALGLRAKTDAVDARMLSAFAERMRPAPRPAADPVRERIALWHKRRDQLVAMRKQERARASECPDPALTAHIVRQIDALSQDIQIIEARLRDLLKADAALVAVERRLRSVPGVGPVTALTLVALLPELGQRSPKTIAALAGLAPYNHDSGQRRGSRRIQGGRRRVREALYMAAVSAARTPTRLGAFARDLRARGKPPKLAFIALARKILVILNAILRDNSSFQTP
jgi:transposase